MVTTNNVAQIFEAFGVLIVCINKYSLSTRRYSKGTNASHDVGNNLAGLEQSGDTLVFSAKLGVPVYLGVVKLEKASCLANFDKHIVRSSEDFVRECSEFALGTNIVNLVDNGADGRVLVDNNLRNDMLVRKIL